MNDLAQFLLARITENEADARWVHVEDCEALPPPCGYNGPFPCDCGVPARLLAECEAKRRIVGLWNLQLSIPEPEYGLAGGEPLGGQGAEVYYDALKALAVPYAGHPDYRPEWRP